MCAQYLRFLPVAGLRFTLYTHRPDELASPSTGKIIGFCRPYLSRSCGRRHCWRRWQTLHSQLSPGDDSNRWPHVDWRKTSLCRVLVFPLLASLAAHAHATRALSAARCQLHSIWRNDKFKFVSWTKLDVHTRAVESESESSFWGRLDPNPGI